MSRLLIIFVLSLLIVSFSSVQAQKPKIRPKEYYEQVLVNHTKTFFFAERVVRPSGHHAKRGRAPDGNTVGEQSFNLGQTLAGPMLMAGSMHYGSNADKALRNFGVKTSTSYLDTLNTFFLIGSLADTFSLYQKTKTNIQKYRSSIEIIHWDYHLLDAQVLLFGWRELLTDLHPLEEYRQKLYSQFPVEDCVIFQVRIYNQNNQDVQYQPFSWHLYLEGPQGQHYKMLKYDPQLDNMIRAGQFTEGFIYFPRKDLSNGKLFFPQGKPVKVVLEEFAGKHGVLEFQ